MMFSTVHQSNTPADNADNADTGSKLPTVASVATLVAPDNPAAIGPSAARPENIDIVVFGDEKEFTAAVMCGCVACTMAKPPHSPDSIYHSIHPVIEGATGSSPEGAMRKLLMATSELLNTIMVSSDESELQQLNQLTSSPSPSSALTNATFTAVASWTKTSSAVVFSTRKSRRPSPARKAVSG